MSRLASRVRSALDRAFPDSRSNEMPARYFAPARINLIGEYIDFRGGDVLPAAIQFGTHFAVRRNTSGRVRAVSLNRPGQVEFDPAGSLARTDPLHWGDYVKAVVAEYANMGVIVPGLDIAIGGDIPGGGLSSSASLEVGIAILIEDITGYRSADDEVRNRKALSRLAQRAENDFVGVRCGVMDQAAIALGRAGHAMHMNCDDLSVTHLPVELGDYCLLVANSCKDRQLGEVAYNERRREVDEAFDRLEPLIGVRSVRDLPRDKLATALGQLDDPVIRRRARHVFGEQHRVADAVDRLVNRDIEGFGQLLNESHESLKDDFEVAGEELELLIALARKQPGVAGARMMGAGFGGCGLVLAREPGTDAAIRSVTAGYEQRFGYRPEFYRVEIVAGAGRVHPAGCG